MPDDVIEKNIYKNSIKLRFHLFLSELARYNKAMRYYDEINLNAAGSKRQVREAAGFREKTYHALVYLSKIVITLAFCMSFVIGYTKLFGAENSIVGVAVLLCIMVFRFADFGMRLPHAKLAMLLIFAIYAVGPRAANALGPVAGALIHVGCIFLMLLFGCHDVLTQNHSTLVLIYLLLYGNDVTGRAYQLRLWGLLLGAVLTLLVYHRNHKDTDYTLGMRGIIEAFDLRSKRTRWQLTLSFTVASMLMLGGLLHLPRAMWAGIAAMSVMMPKEGELKKRVCSRIIGNAAGGAVLFFLLLLLPESIYPMLGILGGFCLGFCATYRWQSVFNAISGMSAALSLLGWKATIFYRIINNAIGAVYGLLFGWLFNHVLDRMLESEQASS